MSYTILMPVAGRLGSSFAGSLEQPSHERKTVDACVASRCAVGGITRKILNQRSARGVTHCCQCRHYAHGSSDPAGVPALCIPTNCVKSPRPLGLKPATVDLSDPASCRYSQFCLIIPRDRLQRCGRGCAYDTSTNCNARNCLCMQHQQSRQLVHEQDGWCVGERPTKKTCKEEENGNQELLTE